MSVLFNKNYLLKKKYFGYKHAIDINLDHPNTDVVKSFLSYRVSNNGVLS